MPISLSPGKWQRLHSLTDQKGRFKMLAIDQRGSLASAISRATGKSTGEVTPDDLARAKASITRVLAPCATAVLTDPEYGYPYSLPYLPAGVGLLLACEQSGHTSGGPSGRERLTRLIPGWSAEKAQRAGADALKLLVYYHPDASEEVRQHQQDLVQRVGEECAAADMPFLLELVAYAIVEDSTDMADFARKKPELVIRSAAEFSQPRYRVDILKLEFPGDLKWTREFSRGAFDGKERSPVYALSEVRGFCQQLGQAADMPWVILSAGVDIAEFLAQVELTTAAGASGFLCGRAIWKDAISHYPAMDRMEEWLAHEGTYNFVRANAYAERARPWFQHPRFASPGGLEAAPAQQPLRAAQR